MKTQKTFQKAFQLVAATTVAALVAVCLILGFCIPKHMALAASDEYLHAPTLVSQTTSKTVVFDDATFSLKLISNGTIEEEKVLQEKPNSMRVHGDYLFLAYSRQIKIQKLPLFQEEPLKNDSEEDFSLSYDIIAFDVFQGQNGLSLVIQANTQNNLELQVFKLSKDAESGNWQAESPTTIISNTLSLSSDLSSQVQALCAANTTTNSKLFFCATQTELCKITTNPNSLTKIDLSGAEKLCIHQNGVAAKMQDGRVLVFNQDLEQIHLFEGSFCDIASNEDVLIATKTADCEVVQLLPEETVLFQNNKTLPTDLLSDENLEFLVAKRATTLKEFPYSLSGQSIAAGTNLIVLKQGSTKTLGMVYATYAKGGKNQYGFVAPADCITIYQTKSSYTLRAVVDTEGTVLPSTAKDSQNTAVFSLKTDETVTVIGNAADISNDGKTFFLARNKNGKVGFVPRSSLGAPKETTKTQKKKTNATINKDTYLAKTSDGNGTVLNLSKGARVQTLNKVDQSKEYTLVSYQTNDGSSLTGYVKTKYITTDGLTTLQIVGIVLLVFTSTLAVFTIAYYAHANKQLGEQKRKK